GARRGAALPPGLWPPHPPRRRSRRRRAARQPRVAQAIRPGLPRRAARLLDAPRAALQSGERRRKMVQSEAMTSEPTGQPAGQPAGQPTAPPTPAVTPAPDAGADGRDVGTTLWQLLCDPWLLLAIAGLLGVLLTAGALLPQLPGQLQDEPAAADRWLTATAEAFGAAGPWLRSLGLFDVLHSPA